MYAQITDGKVNVIEIQPEKVQDLRDAGLTILDISDVNPQPKTGWLYDGTRFIEPSVEVVQEDALFIHVAMSGGDGRVPIGIKNDGTNALNTTVTFRQTKDPASPVITGISGQWRITIRNEQGQVYDIVTITFVDGVASFDYTTDNRPDVCEIRESDFEPIELGGTFYVLKLQGNRVFKVYRELS